MKILFIPNWRVKTLDKDDERIQAPDKYVKGKPYWFFRHFPEGTQVDVLDIGEPTSLQKFEQKVKFYIKQPCKAFRRRNDYDIVISHGAQSGLAYELLSSFVKRKPRHLMFDIGGLNGARVNLYETPLIRFALRKSPAIIVHSSRQLSLYRKHYPNLVAKSTFIPFGTDFDYFNQVKPAIVGKRIIAFGYRKRDYATLCDAFSQIDNKGYELHIIGDDSLASRYANHQSIVFHPLMPIRQLMQFTADSAIVAIPLPEYLYSYGQMSFLQSMAMRKAMIVTDTTSSHDYLSGTPGVLMPKTGDVQSMKDALSKWIATDLKSLAELGEKNAEYVQQNFNEALMGKRIYEFICHTYPELNRNR